MSDLTEFLLARISEDEAAVAGEWFGGDGDPDFMWGPNRVKAVCAALREVVELHRVRVDLYETDYCAACAGGVESGGPGDEAVHDPEPWPCDTLRTLASIWSSHPDYPLED